MKKAERRAARRNTRNAREVNRALERAGENRESCDMRERPEEFDFHGPDAAPGDWAIVSTRAPCGQVYFCMWHVLPDKSVGALPLEPIPESAKPTWTHGDPPKLHVWKWNGDRVKPTLSPSVWRRGHWHGWFKAGRMETC